MSLVGLWFLDHPYTGHAEAGGISPTEMEESIEVIETETAEHGPLSPPCDESGNPTGPSAPASA